MILALTQRSLILSVLYLLVAAPFELTELCRDHLFWRTPASLGKM
jgi:hypothetical protein